MRQPKKWSCSLFLNHHCYTLICWARFASNLLEVYCRYMSKWNRHEKEGRQNTVGVPKLHMLVINGKRARFDANRFNQVNKEEWTCTLTENTWKVIKWKQKYTKARQLLADEWRRRTYAQLYKYLLKGVLSFLFLYFSLEEMGEKVGGKQVTNTAQSVCVCVYSSRKCDCFVPF